MRPRLVRLDTDKATGNMADVRAVAVDFADYVRTNLPLGGKAKADQPLVRFSSALSAFATGSVGAPALDGAEQALKRECQRPGS